MRFTNPASIHQEDIFYRPRASCLRLLKALSSKRRLDILLFLEVQGPAFVYEISAELSLSRECTSQHLRVLNSVYVLHMERIGKYSRYTIADNIPKIARLSLKEHMRNCLHEHRKRFSA